MNKDTMTSARADIEQRVARFREQQAALQRAREGYYETVIEQVRATEWNAFVTPGARKRA